MPYARIPLVLGFFSQADHGELLVFVICCVLTCTAYVGCVAVDLLSLPTFQQLLGSVLFEGGAWLADAAASRSAVRRIPALAQEAMHIASAHTHLVTELLHAPRALLEPVLELLSCTLDRYAASPRDQSSLWSPAVAALFYVIRTGTRVLHYATQVESAAFGAVQVDVKTALQELSLKLASALQGTSSSQLRRVVGYASDLFCDTLVQVLCWLC